MHDVGSQLIDLLRDGRIRRPSTRSEACRNRTRILAAEAPPVARSIAKPCEVLLQGGRAARMLLWTRSSTGHDRRLPTYGQATPHTEPADPHLRDDDPRAAFSLQLEAESWPASAGRVKWNVAPCPSLFVAHN